MYLPLYLSIYLSAEAILRDFLEIWSWQLKNEAVCETSFAFGSWQHQKRSSFARLPQFAKLATSKTKQFCETSLKNGKSSTASCQCVLWLLHSICLKYCACREKVRPGHTKCCICHAKSCKETWRSDTPKCNLSKEISALTSEHLWWRCSGPGVFCTFWLRNALRATPVCTFQHFNFQKWSETEVCWAFWLQNLFRATAACNFWFLIWPDGSAPTALASLLFNCPERQNIGKTLCFATFRPFRASGSSFFWLFLFSDLLSSSFLFSDFSHLCLSICPYCRKFDF